MMELGRRPEDVYCHGILGEKIELILSYKFRCGILQPLNCYLYSICYDLCM